MNEWFWIPYWTGAIVGLIIGWIVRSIYQNNFIKKDGEKK
jgi:hypothetical protein